MAWTAEQKREDRSVKRLAKLDSTYTQIWDPTKPDENQEISLAQLVQTIKTNLFWWEMKEYRAAIPLAIEARIKQLIGCSGASGIGKSYELTKACEKAGLQQDRDWGFITASKDTDFTVAQIYEAMCHQWKLIAFDDHDTLFRSTIMPKVIKTGWGPQRWIQRQTGATPPEGFSVDGLTCVFLSNKDITWFAKGSVDLEAVFRRGQFRNVRGTKTQMFRYIIYRAIHEADFFAQYPASVKQDAVVFFNEHRNRLRNLSLHGFDAICHYYQHNTDNQAKCERALSQALTRIDVHDVKGFDADEIVAAMKKLRLTRQLKKAA
jgi:hypothetical protein